jgi:hypothetical protein
MGAFMGLFMWFLKKQNQPYGSASKPCSHELPYVRGIVAGVRGGNHPAEQRNQTAQTNNRKSEK